MSPNTDTIIAFSTPPGISAVAMLRLSGPEALSIVLPFLSVHTLAPRHATFARFTDNGNIIDEIVATYYPTPHSYTADDMVEITCHGSLYIRQHIIDTLIDAGARLAQPGEFTLRAVRAGKLDLSQAEAVADLIDAVSPAQHRLAVSQLRGGYAQKLSHLREQLVDLTSLLELELDFSQEDVEFADRNQLLATIRRILDETQVLLDSFQTGNAIKHGVPVAIVGAPNVGKSTLLNALLNDDRAIVSDTPGTTRDTIEESLLIDGILFRIIDTAGIRHATDDIERQGILRSQKAQEQASVIIHLTDASSPDATPSADTLNDGKIHILVVNKSDLLPSFPPPSPLQPSSCLFISALTGEGLDRLRQALVDTLGAAPRSDILLSNVRHRDALLRMRSVLSAAYDELLGHIPADLVAIDLRDALYHLGTITGQVTSDDILDSIFSRFCIGK